MSYPTTTRFRAAITASHRIVIHANVLSNGLVVVDGLPLSGGTVHVDRSAAVRRTCTVKMPVTPAVEHLVPTATRRTALDPYGNELKLWRGVRYHDDTIELVPLGVFRIDGTDLSDTDSGREITITGSDRSKQIADAKYAFGPYTVTRGTNVVTAITNVVNDRMPQNPKTITTSTNYTTPLTVIDDNADPWGVVGKLADAAGAEAFFDPDGALIVREQPDLSRVATVDWSYVEGPGCTLLALGRAYDADSTYNAVIITGEGSGDSPATGSAIDDDPASPTYYYGPFGQRPTSEQNPLALTNQQANEIATKRLGNLLGLSEEVQLTVIPNPALDGGDVLQVKRAITGVDDTLIAESFSVPLEAAGTMQITCRTKRVTTGAALTQPPVGGGAGLYDPAKMEIAFAIVSTNENSSILWWGQYGYIEDIADGRGYTAGIVGFCSGTGDMLALIQHYAVIAPGNILEQYIPALIEVNGTDSHEGLDPTFVPDWQTAAGNDALFRQAQDDERDRIYFDPAVTQAQADGLRALGQFIYYDCLVMHGPGEDDESFGGILANTKAAAAPPSQGGNETTYLHKFLDVRKAAMISGGWGDTSRIDTEQRVFVNNGNLDLNLPIFWEVYTDPFTLPAVPFVDAGTVTDSFSHT